ncbi:MAG: TetR/AcrR family transcriptional regulator [bacterium]|nr:TetR/AcrR family transcriptional regulator [bacterium]
MKAEITTEEKIKVAAAKVFTKKGYAATKTRDIAEEANINIASLHYYYRSKEKLFQIVIGEALGTFSQIMDDIFCSELPLHEKIKEFVIQYIDFFSANPYLPIFIVSESQNNPDKINKILKNDQTIMNLRKELELLHEMKVIRQIQPAQFFLNLISLTAFPFLAKPLISKKMDLSDNDYVSILANRKKLIPDMMINFLYYEQP